jgi:peptidoglycan/LPS O-acetylase OafA/YrhL
VIAAGGISYAIYAIHLPILLLFRKTSEFSGNGLTFTVRLFIYFAIILAMSYLLEKIIQPGINSLAKKHIL